MRLLKDNSFKTKVYINKKLTIFFAKIFKSL